MEKQEPSSRKSILHFKALNRLSTRRSDDSILPLMRRQTVAGRSNTLQQPQNPGSQRRASYQDPGLVIKHLPPRSRCLTPSPFESQLDVRPATDEQTQSLLFTLPDEILFMIYTKVVGDTLIHIVRRYRKLGHKKCESNGGFEECKEDQCRGLKLPTGKAVHIGEVNGNLIQLLQTCRKIYVDAVPVLYSSNIFDFDSMEGLITLSCALLPQRFDSIRAVKLDFRFNLSMYFSETTCFNDWPRWQRTWLILSTMESLQRLWVRVSWPKEALYESEEKRYLEPLAILTHLKTYEICLPPLKDEEKRFYDDAQNPFTIVRRSRN